MSVDKSKAAAEPTRPASEKVRPAQTSVPPLFRKIDWLTFAVIAASVFAGYCLTLAPDVTLEDSGELATGSFYAGVPHPPGYPLWTIITWLFTRLIPFGPVAHRVAIASAVAGALASGLLGLMVSRGGSMLIESVGAFLGIPRRIENAICVVAGFVAGLLLAFNGYMWSQSVIVEVYPLSVFSFMCVFCCLLRWMYAPSQRKYLYWAWFLFGVCFTNHQTLILAAMGLEVVVIVTQPKMGRDMLLVNSLLFGVGLTAILTGLLGTFAPSAMVTIIFCIVGVSSIIGCVWLAIVTRGIGSETLSVLIMFSLWLAGAAIFFYMPLTSMTNPPMNWGYARTVDGFIGVLTRGQYEKTNPTNFFKDPARLLNQLRMYFEGATDEFNLINLLLALVPLVFWFRMQRRERSWLVGLAAIWLCMSFLLMILLNPNPDRASRDLIKVFFTASYTVIAIFAGYGITLTLAAMVTCYQRFRFWGIAGGLAALGLAVLTLFKTTAGIYPDSGLSAMVQATHAIKQAFSPDHYGLPIYAGLLLMGLAAAFLVNSLISRAKMRIGIALCLFGLLPLHSIMSHWSDNEQREHWFGYWFGHDMFTPPFGIYPEMERNAILFGGTDPGRFCPTYMIFCESFIPPDEKPREDPKFDRRDVHIITQNALAGGTYLDYIRAQYNRSNQKDPAFFQELFRSKDEKASGYTTNPFAKIVGQVLDRPFSKLGAAVEARRRLDGVYPAEEIYIPSLREGEQARKDYYNDAAQRLDHDVRHPNEPKQIKPGEGVQIAGEGRVTFSGQISVMAINALLAKIIFDRNPTNEFYTEESYPMDWMRPYLTPFGIIMKVNREPMGRLSDEVINQDHQFWSQYSKRLVGNWINYDTRINVIADFVETVHHRRDYSGFIGDRKFIRDDDAQKCFGRLRGSIAGIYDWRFRHAKDSVEQARMLREADFAYRQAVALCPYGESNYRYVQLLIDTGRMEDAIAVAEIFYKMDPENDQIARVYHDLKNIQRRAGPPAATQTSATQPDGRQTQAIVELWEKNYRQNPSNFQMAFDLAGAYLQLRETNKAVEILGQVAAHPQADARTVAFAAKFYDHIADRPKLESTLERLTLLDVHSPEAWYELAAAEALQGKTSRALDSLRRMAEENASRLAREAKATNLLSGLRSNPRFKALQNLPEFEKLAPR